MQFRHYAAALASASLFVSSIAAPAPQPAVLEEQKREELDARAVKGKFQQFDASVNKYFHEPGGNDQLGHYDSRYFHGIVSDEERTDTQLHMIRAYLGWFREQGYTTWIAHGSLLGWWWNGKRFPWDFDLDTQVDAATLNDLGLHHNMTRIKYVSEDKQTEREFLLDINPWIWQRERGDGMNVIDARWIDTRNGLFIDITGLSETHPDSNPGVWSCKNYHRYKTSELYPMRESIFEGVPALIPYAYDRILTAEYQQKALVVTEFQGHKWDPSQKLWLKTPEQAARDAEAELKRQEEAEKAKQSEASH